MCAWSVRVCERGNVCACVYLCVCVRMRMYACVSVDICVFVCVNVSPVPNFGTSGDVRRFLRRRTPNENPIFLLTRLQLIMFLQPTSSRRIICSLLLNSRSPPHINFRFISSRISISHFSCPSLPGLVALIPSTVAPTLSLNPSCCCCCCSMRRRRRRRRRRRKSQD